MTPPPYGSLPFIQKIFIYLKFLDISQLLVVDTNFFFILFTPSESTFGTTSTKHFFLLEKNFLQPPIKIILRCHKKYF